MYSLVIVAVFFKVLQSDSAASPYTTNSLVDEVLTEFLPDRCVISFSKLGKPATYNHYAGKLERELIHIFLKKGYTVTFAAENKASFHFQCEILFIESHFSYTNSILHLLITIDKLPGGESILNREVSVIFPGNSEDAKRFDVIGNLNFLVGAEAELTNLKIDDNTETRTSSVNERDMEIGVSIQFPKEGITSILTVRNRNSFGQDDFKLYKASFAFMQRNTSFLCGIYPLKFGQGSRYLNSSVERPYWNTGLLYDSVITGLSLMKPYKNNMVSFYWGANRNPSMVFATQWSYFNYGNVESNRFGISINGTYVNRDDEYNDIASLAGMEITWQQGEKLFLYGFSGFKYYYGTGVNLERKIIPLFGEYEFAFTNKIVIKGAYLSIIYNVEYDERMREDTLYQEVDYRISTRFMPGLQYERFTIEDFWENNYTFIMYWFPKNKFSERVHKTGINGKIRYIEPEIGKQRLFIGFEGTIQF